MWNNKLNRTRQNNCSKCVICEGMKSQEGKQKMLQEIAHNSSKTELLFINFLVKMRNRNA